MKNKIIFFISSSILFISSLIFLTNSTQLIAQFELRQGDIIDKIVGIVGNEIIMKSDIDAEILYEIERGGKADINDETLRQSILNRIIDDKILVAKAEEDTVSVSDEMIEDYWNVSLQQLQRVYGSIERIETVYRKSLNRMKSEAKEEIKKKLMAQQLETKQFSNVQVNAKEVEEFYHKMRDSFPFVPVQVELYHILKYIEPDTSSKTKTYNLAKTVRDSLLVGGNFAEFAKRYSEDPGSAADGGNLGWVGKGQFVPEFDKAAYDLQINEISMPVESPFGYHIIKLIDKTKDSIHASHILFKLLQSDSDVAKVKNLLDSIRNLAANSNDSSANNNLVTDSSNLATNNNNNNNNNNFQKLAIEYSDDKDTKGFGGFLGKVSLNDLPLNIASTVNELKDNEISAPAPFSNDPTKQGMNIIWRKATVPEHKPTIENDYEIIRKWATDFKIMELRTKWLAELKDEIYWEKFD